MTNSTATHREGEVTKRTIDIAIKIGALLIISSACFDIVKPFITPIIWAAILAVAAKPISDWLEQKFNLGRKIAVTLLTILLLGLLLGPSVWTATKITTSAQEFTEQLDEGSIQLSHPKQKVKEWPLIGERVYTSWEEAANNLEAYFKKHEKIVKKSAGFALEKASGAGITILVLVFSIILSGVFLAYAEGCSVFLVRFANRLAGEKGEKFVSLSSVTIRNVTRGILGVAILQAALAGVGFYAIGLPAIPLLTLVVLIMSIIRLNPILLMLPLAIYVFSYAPPLIAIIYLVWSIAVGLMDNVLTPMIMGKGAQVPTMIIFVGAIGGFVAMGFAGLFVGAVILVVGYELFMVWLNDEKQLEGAAD